MLHEMEHDCPELPILIKWLDDNYEGQYASDLHHEFSRSSTAISNGCTSLEHQWFLELFHVWIQSKQC